MSKKETLEILLSLDNELSQGLKQVIGEMKGLEKTTKEQSKGFQDSFIEMKAKIDVAREAYQAFAGTFNQVMDWGREGAQITQTAESFDLFIDKVGAAPDLLDQLTEASRGTIDNMSLMSSTTTLLAGVQGDLATELANSTPQILEIAKAAQKANPLLGDTSMLYESLTNGIKKNSPLLIDNTGLTLKIGDANKKYAESLGKTVDQLTADEQKQALLNATLEAGAVLIDQVGGNVDSATDSYYQMDVAIKNATDALKTKLAPTITDAANAIVYMLTMNDKLTDAFEDQRDKILSTSESYDQYVDDVLATARAGMILTAQEARLLEKFASGEEIKGQAAKTAQELADKIGLVSEKTYNAADATVGWTDDIHSATQKAHDYTEAVDEVSTSLLDAETAMKEYSDRLLYELASEGMSKDQKLALQKAMGLMNDETVYAISQLDILNAKREAGLLTDKDYTYQLSLLQQTMGNREVIQDAITDFDDLTQSYLDGDDSLWQYADKVRDMTGKLSDLNGPAGELFGKMNNLSDEYINGRITSSEYKDELIKLKEKIEALTDKEITIKVKVDMDGAAAGLIRTDDPYGVKNNNGNSDGSSFKALGGPISGARPYVVGERGPEVFIPSQDGFVIPNSVIQNNFNLGITTMQSQDVVSRGFGIMQALVG